MYIYLSDNCKGFSILGLQSVLSTILMDPFKDPSLYHCMSINKIAINKEIMLKMGYMVTYGPWLWKQS